MSDLEDYLFYINKHYDQSYLQNIYKVEKLCDSVAGNPCYVITITDNVQETDIKIEDN